MHTSKNFTFWCDEVKVLQQKIFFKKLCILKRKCGSTVLTTDCTNTVLEELHVIA